MCDQELQYQDVHLSYAYNINHCADKCALWNLANSTAAAPRCLGATFDAGALSPSGAIGGSQCWLKFNVSEGPAPRPPGFNDPPTTRVHSVQLNDEPPPV